MAAARHVTASSVGRNRYALHAFGIEAQADFALPGAQRVNEDALNGAPALQIAAVARDALSPLTHESRVLRYLQSFDGWPFAMLEGSDGDVLFHCGQRSLFHLSADHRLLRCAPTAWEDLGWQRHLLDTVLWTTSILHGFELLHASAVRTAAGVVAFAAASGGGKSTLALEHLSRGGALFCDDILALGEQDGQVVGYPGPPVMNVPDQALTQTRVGAQVLSASGDERWTLIESSERRPQPLAAVVVLERQCGAPLGCAPVQATTLTLLAHCVGLPHVAREPRRRFELFGALAETTPVLRLTADPSVPAETLATLVEERIGAG